MGGVSTTWDLPSQPLKGLTHTRLHPSSQRSFGAVLAPPIVWRRRHGGSRGRGGVDHGRRARGDGGVPGREHRAVAEAREPRREPRDGTGGEGMRFG